MSTWREVEITVPGGRIRAYRTGAAGAPAVLLAHGLTDNARYWARTVAALAPEYDVALYDARGHGHSSPAPDPFDEATRAADLWAVAEALNLPAPALIGHSMGAATVAAAAADGPGQARGVVLEDPPWVDQPASEAELRAYLAGWKTDLLALRAMPHPAALAQRRAEHPDWAEDDYELSVAARQQADPTVLDTYRRDPVPWRARVQAIECPLLLLTGEPARGAYVTAGVAREAAALGRAVSWVHLTGASHSARYSRFDAYLDAVLLFLRSL